MVRANGLTVTTYLNLWTEPDMVRRNLTKRLEQLEERLAPAKNEPALTIHLTCVGQPDETIEMYGSQPDGWRRPLRNSGRDR
ncbi:MAG: hypothetical protein ABL995_19350 [Bryobacteraceae bacterium]